MGSTQHSVESQNFELEMISRLKSSETRLQLGSLHLGKHDSSLKLFIPSTEAHAGQS